MPVVRRVFISMPADQWLAPNQNDLKWAIVEEIERLGYVAEIFLSPKGKPSLVAGKAWSAIELDEVMRRCVGAVVIGAPRWVFPGQRQDIKLATEFNQYEGAVAYTLNLPMLVLIENDVERRVVFDSNYKGFVGQFSPADDHTWLATSDFLTPFNYWKDELSRRRDVFLGYCSSSTKTARELKRFLTSKVGATVLDWQDPGDLASLVDKSKVKPIEATVRGFVSAL